MATPAQIEANRRNALRSTGPRTPAGPIEDDLVLQFAVACRLLVLHRLEDDTFRAAPDPVTAVLEAVKLDRHGVSADMARPELGSFVQICGFSGA